MFRHAVFTRQQKTAVPLSGWRHPNVRPLVALRTQGFLQQVAPCIVPSEGKSLGRGRGRTFLRRVNITSGLVRVASGYSRTLRLGEAPSDLIGVASYLLGLFKIGGNLSD